MCTLLVILEEVTETGQELHRIALWELFLDGSDPISSVTRKQSIEAQAAQAHYVWVRASEVIWSEYTRIISVLSDAK